jgi:protein-S-isoprenylcysteine O-methyltransferase Ste14
MELIGKTTINPILFYSGKISGYLTWIILSLSVLKIELLSRNDFSFNNTTALLTVTVGLFFVVLSLINLGGSTRLGLPSESTVLKTNGLYKLSRNPMYFGFNLLTISAIIYMLNPVIAVMGIYSILIYHLIILGEENFLEKRFGADYLYYKKTVRRYI